MPLTHPRPFATRPAQLWVLLLLSVSGGRLQAQSALTPSADKLETVVIEATRLGGPDDLTDRRERLCSDGAGHQRLGRQAIARPSPMC